MDSNGQDHRFVRTYINTPIFTKQDLNIYFTFDDSLRDDYNASISGVRNLLVRHSKPNNLLFVGELINGNDFKAKMDHLLCFLPGTLALGVHYGMPKEHLRLAEDLLYTCYQTYAAQPTHLAPEITYFNEVNRKNNIVVYKPKPIEITKFFPTNDKQNRTTVITT